MHILHLQDMPFEQIRSGKKTREARVFDEKRKNLSIGDVITFVSRSDDTNTFQARITALQVFPSFEAMFTILPVEDFGWEKGTTPQHAAEDMGKYYSPDEARELGVVSIDLQLL